MAALDGFRLTVPNSSNDKFRARSVEITHQVSSQFLINGADRSMAIFDDYLDDFGGNLDTDSSPMQSLFVGFGAGTHQVTINFNQWEDSTDTWGQASSSDHAITKLQVLNHAISHTNIHSGNPATLEVHEYNSDDGSGGSGEFDPLGVVVLDSTLAFDQDSESSTFTGQITFAEAADVSGPISGTDRVG